MSYDISLVDPVTKKTVILDSPHHMRGGTYALGGSKEAWINITYNYSPFFYRLFPEKGIRSIYGMTAAESIPVLKQAAETLADDIHPDYWEPTEGNAKRAILSLVALAEMRPDGVWDGD